MKKTRNVMHLRLYEFHVMHLRHLRENQLIYLVSILLTQTFFVRRVSHEKNKSNREYLHVFIFTF